MSQTPDASDQPNRLEPNATDAPQDADMVPPNTPDLPQDADTTPPDMPNDPQGADGTPPDMPDGGEPQHDPPPSPPPSTTEPLFQRRTVVRVLMHVLLAVGIVVFIVGASFISSCRAESLGNEWVTTLRPGRRAPNDKDPLLPRPRNILNSDFPPAVSLSPAQQDRLQNQLDDVRNKAKHHLDVAIYYYSRSFMAILAFSLAAALAAISLAIISKKGIEGVSEYIVTMFLIATALALFYQAIPAVFQQKKNVEDNRALYIKYVNLEDDMISYVATGGITLRKSNDAIPAATPPQNPDTSLKQTDSGNTAADSQPLAPVVIGNEYSIVKLKNPDDFINYVDHQLKKYNDVAIGFDESKAASFAKEQFQTQ